MARSSLPTPFILQGLIWVAIFNLVCLHKHLYLWFSSFCMSYLRCWITLNNPHIFLEINIANLFCSYSSMMNLTQNLKNYFLCLHINILFIIVIMFDPFTINFFLPFLLCNLCRPLFMIFSPLLFIMMPYTILLVPTFSLPITNLAKDQYFKW